MCVSQITVISHRKAPSLSCFTYTPRHDYHVIATDSSICKSTYRLLALLRNEITEPPVGFF
jgi:hypothetical protein